MVTAASKSPVAARFHAVRSATETLCETLETEDFVVQTMPDVSPTKWHLAHTTWFFEQMICRPFLDGYEIFHESFAELFNSYYQSAGRFWFRPHRGLLARPTVREIFAYRAHVNEAMSRLLEAGVDEEIEQLLVVGLNHEQQHQELLLTDIKHVFGQNPLFPVYRERGLGESQTSGRELDWVRFDGGLVEVGAAAEGFSFDNERPRHRAWTEPFELADRLVTCGEWIEFIRDGGYAEPRWWLSEGWDWIEREGIGEPMYWHERDGQWHVFTLGGLVAVRPHEPVCHVSYFEADAFARYSGARLPTEVEWEIAAEGEPVGGGLLDEQRLHPAPAGDAPGLRQLFGEVWEWTQSPYAPYPGFTPLEGALAEYNGKFMCNQQVLRGGSCFTWRDHIRPSYRNFFAAPSRWQMSGLRLARDAR
jgi:ergothioneine biosynthesis protein EgtB